MLREPLVTRVRVLDPHAHVIADTRPGNSPLGEPALLLLEQVQGRVADTNQVTCFDIVVIRRRS